MGESQSPSVYTRYSVLGITFAVTLVVFTYAGYWVGTKFGFEPWGTVAGAALGFLGGTVHLYQKIYALDRPDADPPESTDHRD